MCIRDSDIGFDARIISRYRFAREITVHTFALAEGDVYIAVSYTHLDVYKRQRGKCTVETLAKPQIEFRTIRAIHLLEHLV